MNVDKRDILDALEILYDSCQPSESLALYNARIRAKKIIEQAKKEDSKDKQK